LDWNARKTLHLEVRAGKIGLYSGPAGDSIFTQKEAALEWPSYQKQRTQVEYWRNILNHFIDR